MPKESKNQELPSENAIPSEFLNPCNCENQEVYFSSFHVNQFFEKKKRRENSK